MSGINLYDVYIIMHVNMIRSNNQVWNAAGGGGYIWKRKDKKGRET